MRHQLCDKYGFDINARQQRLELMGFTHEDFSLAKRLQQEVIVPSLTQITDAFYDYLLSHPPTAAFLEGTETVKRLKKTHKNYLTTLGINFDHADYFEYRLQIGIAHARIGLPLSLYQAAYRLLQDLIIVHFPKKIASDSSYYKEIVRFLTKAAALDMSLAIEVYHQSKVQKLSSSIDNLLGEKESLSTQVDHDELTGVSSRHYMFEKLDLILARAKNNHVTLCMGMIDLDQFKKINDSQGHLIGDRVLTDVASRIMATIRDMDIVGRYGGEEFLLLLPDTDMETALHIADRIRRRVADTPIHVGKQSIVMTISIGMTEYHRGDSRDSMIQRADAAMYQAKRNGRNRVEQQ